MNWIFITPFEEYSFFKSKKTNETIGFCFFTSTKYEFCFPEISFFSFYDNQIVLFSTNIASSFSVEKLGNYWTIYFLITSAFNHYIYQFHTKRQIMLKTWEMRDISSVIPHVRPLYVAELLSRCDKFPLLPNISVSRFIGCSNILLGIVASGKFYATDSYGLSIVASVHSSLWMSCGSIKAQFTFLPKIEIRYWTHNSRSYLCTRCDSRHSLFKS